MDMILTGCDFLDFWVESFYIYQNPSISKVSLYGFIHT